MSSTSSVHVSVKLDGVNEATSGLKDVSQGFDEAGKAAKDFKSISKNFNEIGAAFKKVGKEMTKYITVPIMGAITGMGKMFSNLEYEIARVGTLTSDAFDLTGFTQDLFDQSKITGIDTTELAQNVYTALTASVPEDYVMDFVFDAHKLATAGFTDEATAIDVLTTAINAYGFEATDAIRISDMLIGTQDRGKTTVDELGKSLGDVIPIAADNGLSFEQLSAAMALLTRNGIGTARASTYTRSMLQELGKTGSKSDEALRTLAGKGFRGLMEEGYTLSDVLQMLDVYANDNNLTLQDMFGNIRAGTGAMSLMSGDGAHLTELIGYMGETAGRTDENFADMTQTMEYRTKVAFNRLKVAGYEAAMSLAPVWEQFANVMESVAGALETGVKWFTNLSDATQGNIIKFGLLLAALGPIAMVLGGIFTTIGTVTGALGVMSGSIAVATPAVMGLATVFGFLTNPITLAVGGMALLTATVATIGRKFQEDAIPSVNLFGDEVSETTAEAVGNFFELSKESGIALKEMAWSQQEVSEEMAIDFQEKQTRMTEDLLTAIRERSTAERELMEEHLQGIELLTSESKQGILERLDEHYAEEETMATRNGTMINNITQQAYEEGREMTSTELELINQLREEMEDQAITIMSQSELEQKAIREQIALNSDTITAQEAIDVARNAQEKKEAVIEEANETYNEVVEMAILQRDETGILSEAEATAIILEAERTRDETVSAAEEMHENILTEAQEQADGHVIITEDGNLKVLTKWDEFSEKLSTAWGNLTDGAKDTGKWIAESFEDSGERIGESVDETNANSSRRWEEMKTNASEKFTSIKESIVENIKESHENAKQDMRDLGTEASTNWESIKTTISTKVEDAATAVNTWSADMQSKLTTAIEGMGTAAWDKMTDVVDGVSNGMSNAYDEVTGWVTSFYDAGANIVGNIASGITSGVKGVTDAVGGVLTRARNLLPFSPPKDKSSPMYGIEKNGITEQIAKGIMDGEDEVDVAMRHVLRNDLASKYHRNNSVSKTKKSSTANKEAPKSKQPVELVINLGNHSFRKFVEDITDLQGGDTDFRNSFSLS